MNREIIYRGKRCSDGKWVYGFYVESKTSWIGHKPHKSWIVSDAISNGGFFNILGRYAVKDDTVGQFTGLHDKNGKRIFEGDIVEVTSIRYEDFMKKMLCEIVYDNGLCCFDFLALDRKRCMCATIPDAEIEVIGNIHDNTELLNKK